MSARTRLVAACAIVGAAIALLAWAWDTPALLAILAGWAIGAACVIAAGSDV